MPLNNQQIKSLKYETKGKSFTVSNLGVQGLSLKVNKTSKAFHFRYSFYGSQKRIMLGYYMLKGTELMSLKEAKEQARAYLIEINKGNDPLATKEAQKRAAKGRQIKTVTDLWEHYREEYGLKKRSANTELSIWRNYLSPYFGKMSVQEFTRIEIRAFIRGLRRDRSASVANRVQALVSRLGRHGFEALDLYPANPATGLGKKPSETPQHRTFAPDQLKQFWQALHDVQALNEAKVSLLMAQLLKLLTLTLCRRTELTGLEWAEIDRAQRIIILPAKRVKNKRRHIVPISAQAFKALELAQEYAGKQNKYVFPSPSTDTHFYHTAATKAMAQLIKTLELPTLSPHDLRRTGATALTSERFGVSRFIVSRIINHTSDKGGASSIFGTYDTNDYLPEKRKALDAWGAYLDSLL